MTSTFMSVKIAVLMRKKLTISIIAPICNESKNLPIFYRQLKTEMNKLGKTYEIIFIDDGSTDNSLKRLKKIRAKDKKVKIISFRKNFGKSAALAVGFKEAKGSIILTMDVDLQDRPDQIPRFLKKLSQGYDLVCGWRYERKDSFSKVLASFIFNKVNTIFTRVSLHDINCGFKCFTKEVIEVLKIYGELHRFIPVLAYWQGFEIGEIKIKHSPRRFGKSKFGFGRYFSGFFDLLTVIFLTRYFSKPSHVFALIGLISFLLGGGIIAFLVIRKYLFGILIGAGRPLLQVVVFLMIFGIQIFVFGFLAELVVRERANDNQYLIKEKIV